MPEELYSVNVSNLQVRKEPSVPSKVNFTRGTIVKDLDHNRQYKKETWMLVATVTEPIIQGYVAKKYLKKI